MHQFLKIALALSVLGLPSFQPEEKKVESPRAGLGIQASRAKIGRLCQRLLCRPSGCPSVLLKHKYFSSIKALDYEVLKGLLPVCLPARPVVDPQCSGGEDQGWCGSPEGTSQGGWRLNGLLKDAWDGRGRGVKGRW